MERANAWVRRRERHLVAIEAVVHRTDGSKSPVTLSNLSDQGCRIEAAGDFRVGERLSIAIPRMGQVKAQIRWARPGRAGAKFVIESDF